MLTYRQTRSTILRQISDRWKLRRFAEDDSLEGKLHFSRFFVVEKTIVIVQTSIISEQA